MSGQATGWVLRHGPADRGMRAVLVVIADAANREGRHARPGLASLMDGSQRCRSGVLRALAKLKAGGWVVVEQTRRPGAATMFAIPGVTDADWRPVEVQPPGPTKVQSGGPRKGPRRRTSTGGERSTPVDREVQNRTSSPYIETVFNGTSLAANAADVDKPTDDPVKATAHRLAVLAFEQPVRPVTRGGFPAVMARLESALRAAYAEDDLARAIRAGPVTWTADGLTTAIAKAARNNGHGGRPANRLDRQGATLRDAARRYAEQERE